MHGCTARQNQTETHCVKNSDEIKGVKTDGK